MRTVLTSWKEIAQYMGKGVRSVQRWEKEFGLPVRRPSSGSHHAVFAIAEEIDAWARGQARAERSELERLRVEVAELRKENATLRAQLREADPSAPDIQISDYFSAA
ncbi:MAG TPA: hypothetical protein VHE33_13320 [Acidobacteriaceae bacterium]|nr:hypothetical protein [Acidobacteriaceae bacterium]